MWPRNKDSGDSVPDEEANGSNIGEQIELGDDPFPELSIDSETEAIDLLAPHNPSDLKSALTNVNVAEPFWQQWREELSMVGGTSPLLHFVDTPRTRIDLTSMHPGGLPSFISGKATLLSNLIREEFALRNARVAAAAITAKATELRSMRGIEPVYLALGIARWGTERKYCAPVLLRPMSLRRYGKDFELKLGGQPFVNPQLAQALESQFNISLDADSFVALANLDGMFNPLPVIERLRGLTQHIPGFTVEPALLASSFAELASAMVADAEDLSHPVLDALAGNITARELLESSYKEAAVINQDERPPATDTLLLDADPEQERIVAEIAAGNSLIVKTLPGTGGTQTIVNALGVLTAAHKRVLVVSARKSSLDSITQRLNNVGLEGLGVSPRTLRRDLIRAITRNEKATRPNVSDVDDALLRLRKVLIDYRSALSHKDPVLKVSVHDALEKLSALSLGETPPSTTARLPRKAIEGLAHSRPEAASSLIKAAQLGEFKYGPEDSPWYGANFPTAEETHQAHELAKKLHQQELPKLLERAEEVIGRTRMRPFENLEELGIYINLLTDIRDTLDKFLPSVFDRPLTELINATAGRASGMKSGDRRRLKKLAYEYVRPGAQVADMHSALTDIQQQRLLWQRYVVAGAVPEVPVGVSDLQVQYSKVVEDLGLLDTALGNTGTPEAFPVLSLSALTNKVSGLAAESEVLNNLQERTALLAQLREMDLDVLLADLSSRHVPEEQVAQELELAWWQSVLEGMLGENTALLNANTTILDRLEADFRLVDEAHASANGGLLAARLAELWKIGLVDLPDDAEKLRQLLRKDYVSAKEFAQAAPRLARAIAPVWMCSPYEAHLIPRDISFDTVFVVDAGATTIAENAGAITRGAHVVFFGDPVTQTPSPFTTAMADDDTPPASFDPDAWHRKSALAQMTPLLKSKTLTHSYRAGGEELADVVNRKFYGGKIKSLPWAGTFLGHSSLRLHYIADGTGMPDAHSGAVESVDAEVARVVELVLQHAADRPTESLMVITASPKHAVRVEQSVLSAFARRPDLSEFILDDRAEPFAVMTLEQAVAQSRDRVIFSIGYGRTPHGRLLTDFGALALPGGLRLLAVGMTRARRSMEIVSCFKPGDIDESRLSDGMKALAEILTETAEKTPYVPQRTEGEPMLIDLAARLHKRGLTVSLNHMGDIALAASYGDKAVAVETDTVLSSGTLRESLRLRPDLLRRLGWHYIRIHAFELFADPEAVATRIAALIGLEPQDDDLLTGPITIPTSPHGETPSGTDVVTTQHTTVQETVVMEVSEFSQSQDVASPDEQETP